MGVELAHYLSGDAGRFDVTAVRPKSHLAHLVDDSSLDGLQPISDIG
jgi:hypothetical protein